MLGFSVMAIHFNRAQLTLLSNFCTDVSKGIAIAYLVGSAIAGKPTVAGIIATIHAFLTIGLLLAIGVVLLREEI